MDIDGMLINYVKGFRLLYDKADMRYRDNNAKRDAWKAIANMLNVHDEILMKRWLTLRNKFSEIRKKKKNGTLPPHCEWPHYDSMMFLDKHVLTRKYFRSFSNIIKCESSSDQLDYSYPNSEDSTDVMIYDDHDLIIPDNQMPDIPAIKRSPSEDNLHPPPPEPPAAPDHLHPNPAEFAVTSLSPFMHKSPHREVRRDMGRDADISFGRTVGLMMLDIKDLKRRRHLQAKIMGIISEEIANDMEDCRETAQTNQHFV